MIHLTIYDLIPKINQQLINFSLNILIIMSTIIISSFFKRNKLKYNILLGIIIGFISNILMGTPIVLENGNFYDGKTVLFSISGFFFSPITTIIALIIGIVYRYFVIQTGNALIGILMMISSALISYLFSYLFKNEKDKIKKVVNFIIIALVVNIVNVVIVLSITNEVPLLNLLIPYLIIFPIITVLSFIAVNLNYLYFNLIVENNYQKRLLRYSVDVNNKIGIIVVDSNFNYLVFNKTHEEYMIKYLNIEPQLKDSYLIIFNNYPSEYNLIVSGLEKAFNGEKNITEHFFKKDNNVLYLTQEYVPIFDKNEIIAVNIISKDVTEDKLYEQEMIKLSYRDPLTGLYNRRSLLDKIKEINALKNVLILYFDINGLKFMNDAFGHYYGDQLIITIANKIKNMIPEGSLVFRLGGDEFIIAIEDVKLKEGNALAKKISNDLAKQKINEINISLSYGVAIKNDNEDLELTIKRAEHNMYENKIIFSSSVYAKNIDGILQSLFEIDPKLKSHLDNVYKYSLMLAQKIELDEYNISLLKSYTMLHDIGKINIDKELVDSLITDPELIENMKRHVEVGYRILSRVPKHFEIAFDVLTQYENYDGSGYPKGLKDKNIPIKARIIRITNYYDYLTNYQNIGKEKALEYLGSESGKKFDPKLVKAFIELIKEKN